MAERKKEKYQKYWHLYSGTQTIVFWVWYKFSPTPNQSLYNCRISKHLFNASLRTQLVQCNDSQQFVIFSSSISITKLPLASILQGTYSSNIIGHLNVFLANLPASEDIELISLFTFFLILHLYHLSRTCPFLQHFLIVLLIIVKLSSRLVHWKLSLSLNVWDHKSKVSVQCQCQFQTNYRKSWYQSQSWDWIRKSKSWSQQNHINASCMYVTLIVEPTIFLKVGSLGHRSQNLRLI